MSSKSIISTVCLFTSVLLSHSKTSDSITLNNGNTLSGELKPSNKISTFTLKSAISNKPIKIKESSVHEIIFKTKENSITELKDNIQLINGDNISCSITQLNKDSVTINTNSIGNHTIPRNKITKIIFNGIGDKYIYSGPGKISRLWITKNGKPKIQNNKLIFNEYSEAAKIINNLPENYTFEFTTTFQDNAPTLRIYLSSDTANHDKKDDCFFLDINRRQISVKSYNKGNIKTLSELNPDEKLFDNSSFHVALHVDRKKKQLALYINNDLKLTILDTLIKPKGKYFIFKNLARSGYKTEITNIKIANWTGSVPKSVNPTKQASTKHDFIVNKSGEFITANIAKIINTDNTPHLLFKLPFAKKESSIPLNSLNYIKFKSPEKPLSPVKSNYKLILNSGASLSYLKSQMMNDHLNIYNPLLGDLAIPSYALSSVEAIPTKDPKDKSDD